jgi:RNA-binding protein
MSDDATPSPAPLTKQEIRELKSRAQRLDAILKLGKAGLSDAFLKSLDQALTDHELVKVRLSDLKEQRKEIAPQLAAKSGSHLITLLGHVVVLFRRRPVISS